MVTEVGIRDFTFQSDEPEPVGGTNSAPTPMEYVAGAVNSCVTVVVRTVAAERGIQIDQIETRTKAHMDVRGFQGTAEVSPHFQDYTLTVHVVTLELIANRADFTAQVEKRCPAINLVRDASVPFELQWQFSISEAGTR